MFAVPGWSLSEKAPVQEQPKPTKNKKQNDQPWNSPSPSRKRKRSHDDAKHLIKSDNVADGSKDNRGEYQKGQDGTGRKEEERKAHRDAKYSKASVKRMNNKEINAADSPHNKPATFRNKMIADKGKQMSSQPREQSAPTERILKPEGTAFTASLPSIPVQSAKSSLTPLQTKMREKLTSARFRHLNETLYTTSSASALQLFTSSPELFAEYHAGFSQQVKDSWPQNPVDGYIHILKKRARISQPQNGLAPLPRRKTGSCTIADLGCGDAPLARGCQSIAKKTNLRFHSYDLHAPNSLVTVADIANLPLRDGEADIAIFCLSLMGTNWTDFVEEAWRIVRGDGKGEVWIAEVKSRFGRVTKGRVVENSVGKRRNVQKKQKAGEDELSEGEPQFAEEVRVTDKPADETDISEFIKVFQRRGFYLKEDSIDKTNKMFVSMIFVKSGVPQAGRYKGMKWNGSEYQRVAQTKPPKAGFGSGQRGFQDGQDNIPEEEAKVLKPCVYKIR